MNTLKLGLLSGLAFSASALADSTNPFVIYDVPVTHPSFISVVDEGQDLSLFVSSFGEESDTVTKISNFKSGFTAKTSPELTSLPSKSIVWPNHVNPQNVAIDGANYLAVAGGFFTMPLPNQPDRSGTITLISSEDLGAKVHAVAPAIKGWFYHDVKWVDMNNDGRLDLVTARSNFNPIRLVGGALLPAKEKVRGELVWFEQPAQGALDSNWIEHKLTDGPDLFFEMVDLNGDGKAEIIAAEAFQKKLAVYWQDGSSWKERVITKDLGTLFSLSLADLNRDGKRELLVTNHEGGDKGAVYAFEIPADFKTATWIRHDLLTGIKTIKEGQGQASPGAAFAVSLGAEGASKPAIVVSGDGSEKVHLLLPTATAWQYEEKIILESKDSIIGEIQAIDLDNDGWKELLVPEYNAGRVSVVSLKNAVAK